MFIADTNVFYYIATPDNSNAADRLIEMSKSGRLELAYSPIAIVELTDRLVREPSKFEHIKRAAGIFVDALARPLPDPEQKMREIIADSQTLKHRYSMWGDILETVARAPDVASLENGFVDLTTQSKRAVKLREMNVFRAKTEGEYVAELWELVHSFNSRYDDQVSKAKPAKLSNSEATEFRDFLASPLWKTIFDQMVSYRAQHATPTVPARKAVADKKIHLFKAGYEWLLTKTFCDGRHVTDERKNDYNDMHMLVYVNEFSQDKIVSSDKGVITAVASPNHSISFSDFKSKVLLSVLSVDINSLAACLFALLCPPLLTVPAVGAVLMSPLASARHRACLASDHTGNPSRPCALSCPSPSRSSPVGARSPNPSDARILCRPSRRDRYRACGCHRRPPPLPAAGLRCEDERRRGFWRPEVVKRELRSLTEFDQPTALEVASEAARRHPEDE